MSKSHFVAVACMLTLLGAVGSAEAANYACPAANTIDCVPVPNAFPATGWKANGGKMTGNTFAPNNGCGNGVGVEKLPNGKQRLICCYTKCGVYLKDVPATPVCTKDPSGESFHCP